jgi:SSS family solute:Na+ symporter
MAVLTVARQTFPAWMLGVIGGAGALTAMVPAAIMILTAATLFAKNLVRPVLAPQLTDEQVARLAHGTVIALAVVSVAFAIATPTSLVSLLLVGYAGVAQFFPGVILGLTWKRTSAAGVLAGLVCGVVCAAALILSGRDPWSGWNAGFIALCVNFAVVILVSAAVRAGGHGAEQTAG